MNPTLIESLRRFVLRRRDFPRLRRACEKQREALYRWQQTAEDACRENAQLRCAYYGLRDRLEAELADAYAIFLNEPDDRKSVTPMFVERDKIRAALDAFHGEPMPLGGWPDSDEGSVRPASRSRGVGGGDAA